MSHPRAPGILCECLRGVFGLDHFEAYLRGQPHTCEGCGCPFDYIDGSERLFVGPHPRPLLLLAGWYWNCGTGGDYPAGTLVTVDFRKVLENDLDEPDQPFRVLTFSLETREPWASEQDWSVAVKQLPIVSVSPCIDIVAVAPSKGLNYSFSWVPGDDANASLGQLVAAFEAYSRDDFDDMVFAANVGVESSFRSVLDLCLVHFFDSKKRKEFMRNDYSQQLRFWIPIFASIVGAPRLPDAIVRDLCELMELRNQVGHLGRMRTGIERERAAKLLSSAALGYHYTRLLERYRAKMSDEASS